jgi:hypothetical protein
LTIQIITENMLTLITTTHHVIQYGNGTD